MTTIDTDGACAAVVVGTVRTARASSDPADPVVALLAATAVGFVEAGLGTTAVARLHDLAGGDVGALERALAAARTWPSASSAARDAAVGLLSGAARG